MVDSVRFGIDCSIKPELLVVDSNHGFVKRNVIRVVIAGGLSIGILNPIVYGFATALDTETLNSQNCIRKR